MIFPEFEDREQTRGFLTLFAVAVFVVGLTAALAVWPSGQTAGNTAVKTSEQYVIETPAASGKKDSLQLKTFGFKQSFSCGPGSTPSHESVILWAMDPQPGGSVGPGGAIKIFYSDEYPVTLGTGSGVSPMNAQHHLVKPNLNVGDINAKMENGLPPFPAIFLTDITGDSSNTSGDAERGGKPIPPSEIWGYWKSLGIEGVMPVHEPIPLPSGADLFPEQSNIKFDDSSYRHGVPHGGYLAEIIWKVDDLGLTKGHTYRAQFVIHDGDRAGDLAEGCTTIHY